MGTLTQTDPYGATSDTPYGGLYADGVAKRELVGVQAARENFASRIDKAEKEDVHSVVAKRGVPKAVIVPIEWYRRATECLGDPTEY